MTVYIELHCDPCVQYTRMIFADASARKFYAHGVLLLLLLLFLFRELDFYDITEDIISSPVPNSDDLNVIYSLPYYLSESSAGCSINHVICYIRRSDCQDITQI